MLGMKNREFRVRIAKRDDTDEETSTPEEVISPETIEHIAREVRRFVTFTAGVVVAAYTIITIVDTIGEIAVKKTTEDTQE